MAVDYLDVLENIEDGMQITFTPSNVAKGDNFLIFNGSRKKQTVTFHTKYEPYYIDFDGEEPMRLEDVPKSFYESIVKNVGSAKMPQTESRFSSVRNSSANVTSKGNSNS